MRPNQNKYDYVWKVDSILRTIRPMIFQSGHAIPEGSIIRIYRRHQGYHFVVLQSTDKEAVGHKFRVTEHDAFEEITTREWISILNDADSEEV